MGGIGSSYAIFPFQYLAFYSFYKLRDNILSPFPGNTESNFTQRQQLSIILASRVSILQAYMETPLWVFSLIF
jgi:hypothetical protein